ncbi:hypothetical protein LINGRAHAP2_LOCUS29605, partial [Linum grandiflorum]
RQSKKTILHSKIPAIADPILLGRNHSYHKSSMSKTQSV